MFADYIRQESHSLFHHRGISLGSLLLVLFLSKGTSLCCLVLSSIRCSSMEISTVGWVSEMVCSIFSSLSIYLWDELFKIFYISQGKEDAVSFDSAEFLGDLTPRELAAMFGGEFQHIASSPAFSSYTPICSQAVQLEAQPCEETPSKQVMETTEASSFCLENSGSRARNPHRKSSGNKITSSDTPKLDRGNKRARTPTTESPCYTKDHVISERKRRAKLSQQFIALSAIVPGLKKVGFFIIFFH